MDASNPRKDGPGVLAWRTLYTVLLAVLGLLSWGVYDEVKGTSKTVTSIKVDLGRMNSSYGIRLDDHDRRINKLEDWRYAAPGRVIP